MRYVALLRGINVGGNNRVDMKTLKKVFENEGMQDVKTYINSGNIIFNSELDKAKLNKILEEVIEKTFGFYIKVLLRTSNEIEATFKALPQNWQNNDEMKCDIMFLWEEVDNKNILNELKFLPEIDDVLYTPGAVIWRIDRKNINRSGMLEIVGTKLYKQMTIRNCNTVRKLESLMNN